jgi:antitoxin component of RelBE/YafQ-DinJ toxin-antitoxin module
MAKVIFNFLISPENKHRFESVCASNGLTMSSVLNSLIDTYVIGQVEIIEQRASQFQRLDEAIRATNQNRDHRRLADTDYDDDHGPIGFLYNDGGEIYSDNNF